MADPYDLAGGGGHVPVAVTVRSGFPESVHFGTVVAIGSDGRVVAGSGDMTLPLYPRSALKPLQAAAMIACGLDLPSEQLAIVCASHDGTERHVALVRDVLASAGLDESALGNVASLPLEPEAASDVLRTGGEPAPVLMNCSGKHAGMLATCVVNGWPVGDYLAVEHPLQRAITGEIERRTGDVVHVGMDGCGAPTHVVALVDLAQAVADLARTSADTGPGMVRAAMTAHPEVVGGERRTVTMLMRAVPGLLCKDGAEGVLVGALPDGRAFALKVADGAPGAVGAVATRALSLLGVDTSAVPDEVSPAVQGGGRAVGEIRAVFP